MEDSALETANFLQAVSHEGWLLALCYLLSGEKYVTEIQEKLSIRQAEASQHLMRLRLEGMVATRLSTKVLGC
ncbi:ArsR/SmtB family transcription factor [Ruegeria atlantica]|uniref:ArsR/SmtB family transcription factor n=1 Tax=Ruegeria atlantica TaxID=81569 RepID=UPI00147A5AB5